MPKARHNLLEGEGMEIERFFRAWRVWLLLSSGGIMGIPFPAENKEHAEGLAKSAERIFGGHIIEIEDLGYVKMQTGR